MVTKCSFNHTLTGASNQKLPLQMCPEICTYKGIVMDTTKSGIIWSQNVYFVTTLLVPKQNTYLTKVVKEYALIK